MFSRYEAYRAQLAANLSSAPNLDFAKAQPTGTHPDVKASVIGAANLGDAWFKLTGAVFTNPVPTGGFGKIYQELRGAALLAQGVQSYATCKAGEQADKASQIQKMIAKLEDAQKHSGSPQASALVQKGLGGDRSTITGKTDGTQQTGAKESSLGSSLDNASKLLTQAGAAASAAMKQQPTTGSGSSSSAIPSVGETQSGPNASAPASVATATQVASYALLGNTTGVGETVTTSASVIPAGVSQVGSAIPIAAAKTTGTNPALANFATTTTGSSGSSARASGAASLASSGSVSAGSSATAGGAASLVIGSAGASAMSSEVQPGNSAGGQQSSGGGSFGSAGSPAGGSGSASSALSPDALKDLDAQFNAATSGAAAAKFDLAPLPSLAALPSLDAPATSSTPLPTGLMTIAMGEDKLGSAPDNAAATSPEPQALGVAQNSQPRSAQPPARADTLTRSPESLGSQPFLGSDNVSLFQRVHNTHERAQRLRLHPVAAGL